VTPIGTEFNCLCHWDLQAESSRMQFREWYLFTEIGTENWFSAGQCGWS